MSSNVAVLEDKGCNQFVVCGSVCHRGLHPTIAAVNSRGVELFAIITSKAHAAGTLTLR